MQKDWKLNVKHDCTKNFLKGCRNMDSRFHVQGHVHGHLQCNSGDERAWFWFLSLQWMANKRFMLSFGLENTSNMDFDLQLFQAFFNFGFAVSAALRSCF